MAKKISELTELTTINSTSAVEVSDSGVSYKASRMVQADANNNIIGTIVIRTMTESAASSVIFANGELVKITDTSKILLGNGFTPGGETAAGYLLNNDKVTIGQSIAADSSDIALTFSDVTATGGSVYPDDSQGAPAIYWSAADLRFQITGLAPSNTKTTGPTYFEVIGCLLSKGNGVFQARKTSNYTMANYPESLIVDTSSGNVTITLDPDAAGLINQRWPEGTIIEIQKDGINNNANNVVIATNWVDSGSNAAKFYSVASPAGTTTYSFNGRWAGVRIKRLPSSVVEAGWYVEPYGS